MAHCPRKHMKNCFSVLIVQYQVAVISHSFLLAIDQASYRRIPKHGPLKMAVSYLCDFCICLAASG